MPGSGAFVTTRPPLLVPPALHPDAVRSTEGGGNDGVVAEATANVVHRPAGVDLLATNLATAWGAETSRRLNLEVEDRADDLIFNEIIWKSVKGAASPMPPPVRAAFVLPRRAKDSDDD